MQTDKYGITYCSNCLEPIASTKYCKYCEVHTLRTQLTKVKAERDYYRDRASRFEFPDTTGQ